MKTIWNYVGVAICGLLCSTYAQSAKEQIVIKVYETSAKSVNIAYRAAGCGGVSVSALQDSGKYTYCTGSEFMGGNSRQKARFTVPLPSERRYAVNSEGIEALLKIQADDSRLKRDVYTLFAESAYALGVNWAQENFPNMGRYWRDGLSSGTVDTQGRENPLAVAGLYAEYVVMQQVQETTGGFHSYLAGRSVENSFCTAVRHNYPEESASAPNSRSGLCAMLRVEELCVERSQIKGDEKKVATLTHRINSSGLPKSALTYLEKKYPYEKAEEQSTPEEEEDIEDVQPEDLPWKFRNPELAHRNLEAYATFLGLLDEPQVWEVDASQALDPRLKQVLTHCVLAELEMYVELSEEFLKLAGSIKEVTTKDPSMGKLALTRWQMTRCAESVQALKEEFPQLRRDTDLAAQEYVFAEKFVLNELKAENKLHALVIPYIPNWALDAILGGLSQGARMSGNTKTRPYTPKVKYEKGSLLYYWLDDRAANIASTMLVREYAPEVLRRNPEAVRQLMEERQRTAKELEKFLQDKK